MPKHNLIEYIDKCSKKSGNLWEYYRDKLVGNIVYSESFTSKISITGKTPAGGNSKNAKMAVLSKFLSSFWRTLEMH